MPPALFKIVFLFLIVTSLLGTLVFLTMFYFNNRRNLREDILFTSPHTIQTIRFVPSKSSAKTVKTTHQKELHVDKILDKIKASGYKVYYNTFDSVDPNYEISSSFRQKVYQKQLYNLDIHGMDNKYSFDISIGTGGIDYNLQRISQYLQKIGLKLEVNGLFKANGKSLTKYLNQNYSVKSIQVELSLDTRERQDIDTILIQLAQIFVQDN